MTSVPSDSPRVRVAPAEPGWDATAFVWTVWILMLGAALWFAWTYGSKYPYFDDFGMTHWLTGEVPVSWSVLWEQYNDHRIPLPRLIWLFLYRIFGGDFRTGMFLNIILIAAVAAVLIHAAKRIRGRLAYSDAFFPVLLLTWQGKLSLFLWNFILQMALSTALAGVVLAIMASHRSSPSPAKLILAGICVALMPLCGANGLALALGLALWFLFVSVHEFRASGDLVRAEIALGFALLTIGVIVLCYIGFDKKQTSAPDLDLAEMIRRLPAWDTWKSMVMFVSMGFGMSSQAVYRLSVDGLYQAFSSLGPTDWADARSPYAAIAILAVLFFIVTPLIWIWLSRPPERVRAVNLAFFLAACGGLTLAIGVGRGGEGLFDQDRYTTLVAPLFSALYLIWVLANGALGRLMQLTMFAVFVVLLIPNSKIALRSAEEDREAVRAFEKDMLAGLSSMALADKYAEPFVILTEQENREAFAGYMLLLKKHGNKHYAALQHHEVPLDQRIDLLKPPPPGIRLDSGWYDPDADRRWTNGKAVLKFWLFEKLRVRPLRLRMLANTFGPQPIVPMFNGEHLGNIRADGGEPKIIEIDLSPSADLEHRVKPGQLREYNILTFNMPEAHSPKSAGQGDDGRPRGLGIVWIEFISDQVNPKSD